MKAGNSILYSISINVKMTKEFGSTNKFPFPSLINCLIIPANSRTTHHTSSGAFSTNAFESVGGWLMTTFATFLLFSSGSPSVLSLLRRNKYNFRKGKYAYGEVITSTAEVFKYNRVWQEYTPKRFNTEIHKVDKSTCKKKKYKIYW